MRLRVCVCTISSIGLMATSASAQSAAPVEPRWEVSFRVGGLAVPTSEAGRGALPPAGENVAGTGPFAGRHTRFVPSWFFGDGQALILEASAPTSAAPSSIDRVLTTASAKRPHTAMLAASVSRRVGGVRAEVNLEASRSGPQFTSRALTEVATAARWFENSFAARLQGPLGFQSEAASVATLTRAPGTEVVLTGLLFRDWHYGRDRLSVGAGGGVLLPVGDDSGLRLTGTYRVSRTVPTPIEFEELDTVDLRVTRRAVPVLAAAGTWARSVSSRVGLRGDARIQLLLGGGGYRTVMDAVPETRSSGTTSIATGGVGAPAYLVFSSVPTFPSSLSAPPVRNFTTFKSGGVHARYSLSGGFYVRF